MDGASVVKVPLAGGAPVTICDSCTGYSFTWGSDDTVRYHTAPADNGQFAGADGGLGPGWNGRTRSRGPTVRRPRPSAGRSCCRAPAPSCSRSSRARPAASRALDLDTRAITRFDQPGFGPQWVDGGFVALGNADGTLIALPFDAEHGAADRTSGDDRAGRVATGRLFLRGPRYRPAERSSTRRSGGEVPRRLVLVSRSGQATPLLPSRRRIASPRFSPDGRRLALGIADPMTGSRDVWVLDVGQRAWSRLTTNGISDKPIWTPDGRRLVYSSNDDLWWIAADGSGRPESLLVAEGSHFAGSVTPDGRTVVFQESGSVASGIRTLAFDSAPASPDHHSRGLRRIRPGALARRALAGVPVRPDGTDGGVRPGPIRCPAPGCRSRCRAAPSRYGPTAAGSCSIARATA